MPNAEKKLMNGHAPGLKFGQRPPKQPSTRKYKWLSLLFAVLNVVWIILLIYMITALKRPEEPCKPTETGARAESETLCLPRTYLGQSESSPYCCSNSTTEWQNCVTAFVNVEFARSKRSSKEKAVTKRSLPGLPNRGKRAVADEAYYWKRRQEGVNVLLSKQINQTASYIVTAEVTLDFLDSNITPNASCSLVRRRGETPVLFKETVAACSLKSDNGRCKAPISIGGSSLLEAGETVYLEIDRLPELVDVTTKVLTVVLL